MHTAQLAGCHRPRGPDGCDAAGRSHSGGNDGAGTGDVTALARSCRSLSGLSSAAGPERTDLTASFAGRR